MGTTFPLDQALRAVGELLARRGQSAAIVVVGGTALNLLQVVERATRDVDVIASAAPRADGPPVDVRRPDPLPQSLADAIATVGRDLGLPPDWVNTTVAGSGRQVFRQTSRPGSLGTGTPVSGWASPAAST